MSVSPQLLSFLTDLKQNNSREWFAIQKDIYDQEKANFDKYIGDLILEFADFENMDGVKIKDCSYRIYRDVRFSKNKEPYKTWFSASFSEGGRKSGYMDYYLHIEPGGKSFLGGGMYNATSEQLANFRQEVDYNAKSFLTIVESPLFRKTFGLPEGESLRKIPKGFPVDHPEAEWLKRKQLFYWQHFTDEEIVHPEFTERLIQSAKVLKPFLDFLNAIFFEKEPFLK